MNANMSDTPKSKICGGRTATVRGVFYYEQDSEPYMADVEEEAECGDGECHVCAFVCDDCGNVQGLAISEFEF